MLHPRSMHWFQVDFNQIWVMQFEDSDRSDFWLLSKNVGTQSWPKAQRQGFWSSVSGPPSPWPGFSYVCLKKGSLSIDTNDRKNLFWGCLCDPFLVRKFESHHFDCVSWFFYQQKTEAKSSKSWRYPAVNSVDEAADGIPTASPIDRRVLRVHPFLGGMTETWWAQTIMERCFGNISQELSKLQQFRLWTEIGPWRQGCLFTLVALRGQKCTLGNAMKYAWHWYAMICKEVVVNERTSC